MRKTFNESRKEWVKYLNKENENSDSFISYTIDILWEYEADEDCYFISYINPKNYKAEIVQLWNEHGACYFEIYKYYKEV